MPKRLPVALITHYQQSQTTLARCLRIERRDGNIMAFTEHDHDLIIDGICYQSAAGYTPTAISIQDKGAVNTVDVEGVLSAAGVSRDDIAAGLFDGAQLFVFEVNYDDVSQGILPLISGFWGECQLHDNHYVTEFKSLSQVLQHSIGECYSTTCRAQLGDARCLVNVAELRFEGVVVTIENNRSFTAKGFDQPTNYFRYGLLTWQQSKNAGLSIEIKSFQSVEKQNAEDILSSTFQLMQPMLYAIEVGDIFSVIPGCDKSLTMCKERFNNVVNFRGEPFVPGLDQMLKTP